MHATASHGALSVNLVEGAMPQVLLLGASGGMGQRIAALWPAHAPGVPLVLGTRRPETLAGFAPGSPVVRARLDEPASLRSALAGATVVINAVGPYAYDPAPLLDACAAAGAHYVDLASEPDFLAAVQAWAGRDGVRIALCPGASTVPGLIELAAAHLAGHLGAAPPAFDVFLSMGSANPLTPGLLASLTLQLGRPLRSPDGGASYRQLRRRTLAGLGPRLFGRYPAPFDGPGLDLGGRHVPARFWVGLDRPWIVRALRLLSFVRPRFRDDTWIALAERARPLASLASWVGGRAGGMRVEALDAAGQVLGAVSFRAPREGLNVPALPAVWAARALLAAAAPGLHPLRALVTFADAAASLRAQGFEVHVEPSAAPGPGNRASSSGPPVVALE